MSSSPSPVAPLSNAAFATLLLIALMMGANHVAARLAFDHGHPVNRSRFRRTDLILHLHCLHHHQPVARPNRIARFHQHAHDFPRHGS